MSDGGMGYRFLLLEVSSFLEVISWDKALISPLVFCPSGISGEISSQKYTTKLTRLVLSEWGICTKRPAIAAT